MVKLVDYFGRFSKKRQGLVLGVDNLSELFQDKYYRDLQGGILEAFGRMFSKDLKILVYPFLDNSTSNLKRKEDIDVHPRFRPIMDYLFFHNRILDIEEYDQSISKIFSHEVLEMIRSGKDGWEECLPKYVDTVIKDKQLFGYNTAE